MKKSDLSWQRRVLSIFISLICFPKFIFKRKIPHSIQTILIIEWNYLGDIIVATPAIRTVKESYTKAKVFLLTNPENREYANSFNFVDEVIYIKNPLQLGRRKLSFKAIVSTIGLLRSKNYDLIIELGGRLTIQFFLFFMRSKYLVGQNPTKNFYLLDKSIDSDRKHQIERNFDVLKLLGINKNSNLLWDPTGNAEEKFTEELLAVKNINKKYVIIHPLASWQPKEWLLENWKIVAEFLIQQGLTVIFIGTQTEFQRIEKIMEGLDPENSFNFAGFFNILQLIAFMKKASFFIGSDSGPMHLAAIANLKSIILFGPGDPDKWAYLKHVIIYKKPHCGPCAQLAYRTLCSENLKTCKGLMEISPQEVIEKCKSFKEVA